MASRFKAQQIERDSQRVVTMHKQGVSTTSLAQRFGVSRGTISRIIREANNEPAPAAG